jgi:hypothetical protein
MKRTLCLVVTTLLVFTAYSQNRTRHRILFNRFRMPEVAIFAADPDGKNERPLVPHRQMEYSPSPSTASGSPSPPKSPARPTSGASTPMAPASSS